MISFLLSRPPLRKNRTFVNPIRRVALHCRELEERSVPAVLSSFLTTQHADLNIGYTAGPPGTWFVQPRDADASPEVSYNPADVLLYVGAPALTQRAAGAQFDFIGVGAGEEFHRLPQSQNPNTLYLGVASYGVTPSTFDSYNPSAESKGRVSGLGRWVKMTLVDVDHFTPDGQAGGGIFSAWQSGDLGPIPFLSSFNDGTANPNGNGLDATDGIGADDALWVVAGGHIHYNYGFSEPGRYEVTVRTSGYLNDSNTTSLGQFVESAPITLYFSVGSVGQVAFDPAAVSVDEAAGTATVTVRRTGGSDGRITVAYATSNGSATAGADYTAASGTITFNDGEVVKTFTVPIANDTADEGDETINVTLSNPGPSSIADYIASPSGDNSNLIGAQSTAVLTIVDNDDPANLPPTIGDVANQSTAEETAETVDVVVGDAETPVSNLSLTATSSNTTLLPNASITYGGSGANRNVTFTPALNQTGTTTITLTVTDANGATATDTFVLTVTPVNDTPTANTQTVGTSEGTPLGIALTGADVDGDTLTYAIVTGPGFGTLTGTGANRTYTPNAGYFGPDSFVFRVNDGTVDSADATVSITVSEVNEPPLASEDAYTLSVGNVVRGNVLFNDTDPEDSSLTASITTPAASGTVVLFSNGSFVYTPTAGFSGSDSFTYTTTDAGGETATATVIITAAGFQDFEALIGPGHADVGINYEDGEWDLHIHDEETDSEYEPSGAAYYVAPAALGARPDGAEFDFIGVAAGQPFYRLPQSQNPELLLLGLGTEEMEPGTFEGGIVRARLLAVNGPGHFSVWRSTDDGPAVAFSTADGVTEADFVDLLEAAHADFNWGFTAAGRYEVTIEASGTLIGETEPTSGAATYYFVVDSLGRFQFQSPSGTVAEGGSRTLTIQRVGGSDGIATVEFAADGGTATEGDDYAPFAGSITFGDGETERTFTVETLVDGILEGSETLTIALAVPTGSQTQLGAPATSDLSIVDSPPTASITTGPNASIEGAPVRFDGTFTGPAGASAGPFAYTWRVVATNGQVIADAVGTISAAEYGSVPDFGFTPADNGTYTVTLVVADSNGLISTAATRTLTVSNAAPTATLVSSGTGPVLISFAGVTDASAIDAASLRYSFDLNNDGDFTDAGEVDHGIASSLLFNPFSAGDYAVRGRVTDKDGDFTDIITVVTVRNIRLSAIAVGQTVLVSNADGSARFTLDSLYVGYVGRVNVATGDVTGDGVDDIVVGTLDSTSHIKVFDGVTGAEIRSFIAYQSFNGGVNVAVGDLDGDGIADIVTGTAAGATPHVKAFSGRTGAEIRSFYAYAPAFSGGVDVAVGDVTGDGRADIITGTASGAAHVKAFDGRTSAEVRSFLAYPGFVGGISVAAGDLDGDGFADIITGAGPGGAPHVKAFSGRTGGELASFLAYDPGFAGGVRVGVVDRNGDGKVDIITGAGPGAGPHVKIFDGRSLVELGGFLASANADFNGGVYVG